MISMACASKGTADELRKKLREMSELVRLTLCWLEGASQGKEGRMGGRKEKERAGRRKVAARVASAASAPLSDKKPGQPSAFPPQKKEEGEEGGEGRARWVCDSRASGGWIACVRKMRMVRVCCDTSF